MKHDSPEIIASNRKARHNYTIVDVIEAGIVLHGSEVKSLREGQVQIAEAYAHVVRGEMWLEGVHVAVYRFSHGVGSHEPMRSRKLLLHREQIRKLQERMAKERLTLVVKPSPRKNQNLKCAAKPAEYAKALPHYLAINLAHTLVLAHANATQTTETT